MATKRSGHTWKKKTKITQTNKNRSIKGQSLKAYCCPFFKTAHRAKVVQPETYQARLIQPWNRRSLSQRKQFASTTGSTSWNPPLSKKTLKSQVYSSLSGVFLVATAPPALLPKHLFPLRWPRASPSSLTSWGFESAEVFLEAQRKWSWLFPCTCFPFLLPFPGLYLVSPQCENLGRNGLGLRRETEKGKETDRWRGAWEKPTGA